MFSPWVLPVGGRWLMCGDAGQGHAIRLVKLGAVRVRVRQVRCMLGQS